MTRRIRVLALLSVLLGSAIPLLAGPAQAAPGCQQVLMVFARGSGAELSENEATTFFEAIDRNLGRGIRRDHVEVGDLDQNNEVDGGDYPAVAWPDWFAPDARGVFDPEDPALLGGYNQSRRKGTEELVAFLDARAIACPAEIVVLGGHSQGAHVVGAALSELTDTAATRVAYVALFGDPKFNPGGELSRLFGGKAAWARGNSRWYHDGGILKPREPYLPDAFVNRTGSWCDKQDGICTGNLLRILDDAHKQYPDSEMLEAANEISVRLKSLRPELGDDLVVTPLPIAVRPTPNVDVAFVVDTTGSMYDDIANAQAAIDQITTGIFGIARSPRVALIDYKDLGDPYQARVDSPFTADRAAFASAVNSLTADGGGDTPESVYSGLMAAFGLDWRPGALKLAILLGDAPAHDPEPGTGHTLTQALQRAFELDPVVIDPILIGGSSDARTSFTALADGSSGRVFEAAGAGDVVQAIHDAIEDFSLAPVAQADGPYTAAPGEEIRFNGAGSFDPDGAITEYAWDFNNDGVADEVGTSPVAVHKYLAPYQGLASLTVTGNDGRKNTATAEVNVAPGQRQPQPPSSPRALKAARGGSATVEITWQKPTTSGDGPIGGYLVYSDAGTFLGSVATDQRQFTVDGVPANQDVSFMVEALNEFGASSRATSNTVRLEGATTTPPTTTVPPSTTSSVPASTSPPPLTANLAKTGSSVGLWVMIGAIALCLGLLLIVVARTTRRNS